ncbi:unnamed protein product, partial [Meganyctiphanes norvegica]
MELDTTFMKVCPLRTALDVFYPNLKIKPTILVIFLEKKYELKKGIIFLFQNNRMEKYHGAFRQKNTTLKFRIKMAALPPRRNPTPTNISRQHLSPLQILTQMGFPKHRAEKALAATGHRGVQLASDWLLAHVNDPVLDLDSPREYVVYLCPSGPLSDQIESFWLQSLEKCGWNGAHNLVPHITLCSFFKTDDENVETLVSILKNVVSNALTTNPLPQVLSLEKYISQNYMGLFLNEQQADVFKKIAVQFVKEISSLCGVGEVSSKSLHLTLAYQFPPSNFAALEPLAEAVKPNTPAHWEIRLYSRDSRIAGKEVHKVIYSHVPRDPDELELLIGDFVYVSSEELSGSVDGWVEGTSWLTGGSGYLPMNYIERTVESDAWTLHRSITVVGGGDLELLETLSFPRRPPISLSLLNLLENSEGSRRSTEVLPNTSTRERLHSRQASQEATQSPPLPQDITQLYAKVNKVKKETSLYKFPIIGPRRIMISRHGERVDFTFGDWVKFCFDETGKYTSRDLNMPKVLPVRKGSPNTFNKDCPLTNVGLLQAELVGTAMKDTEFNIHHVYVSPSLRCVQTATNILKGLGLADVMPLNIEPGLFEWLAWYHEGMPTWMTTQEVQDAGYNINMSYEPLISPGELNDTQESCEQYYGRNFYVTKSLINNTQKQGGNILLVGHAATLDTCTRQLIGKSPRSAHEMTSILKKIPYCSFSIAAQDSLGNWKLQEPPFPSVTHSSNMRYDWKVLQVLLY